MRAESAEIWVQATGASFKLHRCLGSLYPVKSNVRVMITDCGDAERNNDLRMLCFVHGVVFFFRPWTPIVEGTLGVLSQAGVRGDGVVILCHDDVIFPADVRRYIREIVEPIINHDKVGICGGKVWDSYYHNLNAYGRPPEFPGKQPYPDKSMAVSCVHSACMAIRMGLEAYANSEAEFDFERILSYGGWNNEFATVYRPTTDVLWHEKGGTVDRYHELPKVAAHIISVTKRTDKGTGFDEKWWAAYGESPRESLDKMGEMAAKFAKSDLVVFREVADGIISGSPITV